jgi:hypothetical protein
MYELSFTAKLRPRLNSRRQHGAVRKVLPHQATKEKRTKSLRSKMFNIDLERQQAETTYYQCPTCDLYVDEGRPLSITVEDSDSVSYDYPLGKIVKWYYKKHFYDGVDGDFVAVPLIDDGIFTLKLGCLHQTFWEAELAQGEPIK